MPMISVTATDPDSALYHGLRLLNELGVTTQSRNGRVLVAPGPVVTAFIAPCQRVSFDSVRDANPFFHLFESLWMLAGRNDVAPLRVYVDRIGQFSDDDKTLNGAYGFRWRDYFGYDQLLELVALLKRDHSTRRAVLSMWNAMADGHEVIMGAIPPDLLNQTSKDLPCNTHVYFDASRGQLDMTVCCRSNDVVWGAYGANVVQFSFLHEFIALAAGLPLGTYYQMSNNYHIYLDRPDIVKLNNTARLRMPDQLAYLGDIMPLINNGEAWPQFLGECGALVDDVEYPVQNEFLLEVAQPMLRAHALHRAGATKDAIFTLGDRWDWHIAGEAWLRRRLK